MSKPKATKGVAVEKFFLLLGLIGLILLMFVDYDFINGHFGLNYVPFLALNTLAWFIDVLLIVLPGYLIHKADSD